MKKGLLICLVDEDTEYRCVIINKVENIFIIEDYNENMSLNDCFNKIKNKFIDFMSKEESKIWKIESYKIDNASYDDYINIKWNESKYEDVYIIMLVDLI